MIVGLGYHSLVIVSLLPPAFVSDPRGTARGVILSLLTPAFVSDPRGTARGVILSLLPPAFVSDPRGTAKGVRGGSKICVPLQGKDVVLGTLAKVSVLNKYLCVYILLK